jgi:hypothetical protein
MAKVITVRDNPTHEDQDIFPECPFFSDPFDYNGFIDAKCTNPNVNLFGFYCGTNNLRSIRDDSPLRCHYPNGEKDDRNSS